MMKCLVEDVRSRLRSGVAINSLAQCVEELVLNSIDAKATCVAIRVDLETFKVQVVDNGSGMGREDLNKVGNRYFTSKCNSVEDLENLKFYGFRGEAVASIANMASIVEISSKTNNTVKTFMKLFQNGKALEVCEAELTRPSGGTTVTVYNLFHQLPVRKKCMDPMLEFERVRQKVEALSLIHPSVSFSLRNDASCSMTLQLPKTKDMCSRFCQIYGLGRTQKLRKINYTSGGFELSGYISSEGHYNKNMQFLYVNNRLVLKTRLHKLMDFLLRKESVICKAKGGLANRHMSSSPVRHRGPELYGIFVINVKCQYCDYDVCLEPAKTLIEFRNWDALLACIEEGVKAFLKREHLFVELSSEDIKEFNEDNGFSLYGIRALQPALSEEKSIQDNFKKTYDDIVDSYEMFNLQSKTVKRKVTIQEKSSDLINSNDNAEKEVSSGLIIAEPADTASSLLNKEGTTSNFSELGISEQEPKEFNNPKMVFVSCKSSENLSGESRSERVEIESYAEMSRSTENCVEDARMREDSAAQKSSINIAFGNSVTQGQHERVEDTADGPELLCGRALMGMSDVMKDDSKKSKGPNNDGEGRVVRSVPLKLCSTGLITHVMQNQPPHEQTEMNCSLNMHSKPGPVIAKDIFGNKMSFSVQGLNVQDTSSILNKEYTTLPNREVCRAYAYEWLENETVSDQKNEEVASNTARDRRESVTSHTRELLPVTSLSFAHNENNPSNRRQMVELSVMPRTQAYKKLSLSVQLGSLERFRRHYGKVRSAPSVSIPEKRSEFEPPGVLGCLADLDTLKNQNNNFECVNIRETQVLEHADSNICQADCLLSLERSQFCGKETLLNRKAPCVRESPLTLTDYSQIRRKDLSSSRSLGSLASKLFRMKGDHKEFLATEVVGQVDEQFQGDSSRRGNTLHLLSQTDDFLQSSYQMCQSSSQEVGVDDCILASAYDEQDVPCKMYSTRGGTMENAVNQSLLINTDGEYMATTSSGLVLHSEKSYSEGICKDGNIVSSKQTSKATELPNVTLSSSLEVPGDVRNAVQSKNEESIFGPVWMQHFDVSLGKMVYVNKMTGLSTYSTPPTEELQAACTKDITTMAVNVVLQSGFQCRCHPFRSELVLPFLPRPREERILASQDFRDADGESLRSLFSEWDNPVFARYPEVAVDVSSGQAGSLAVKIHNILYPYRFTKEMINSMQVLHQVDNKFIACLINTRSDVNADADGNLLVLVDQHAAHERIRLEQLIADSYEKQPEESGKKKLLSSTICPPLEIEVTEEQRRLLRCCRKSLEEIGLELSFPENNSSQILVGKVPLCFMEREANELRRKRQPVAKSIVEELIQEQVELLQTTGGAQGTLPLTFLKVLASQACHGAIKFNDSLTKDESCQLIEALSSCQLPFQCAHGRPSMMPLADIDHLKQEKQPKPNLSKLRRMAHAWQLFGKQGQHLEV
ncbi:DNA mismatch repair protein Mlh3 isoform X3 [Gopherus evgoodei]|uniref:MutL homolog 3 n=2 Tax=Gopherus evgoodei TaxID=1825980 RepID=A0A8C4VIW3_9SAUR|nr:DNA mismatch repair protein Mlh3 isoform X3 [Gopherus evgoodei]XP_030414989.1 DNA mismatch repair protein Mlh3 isoform X3 [Gopherus evgoodei]XP_030414990.1 DNA mismatch repair protein Mlh3 isoform X3 [Gopherus evgoodei]XP_030414991.1 DNA mismatch repair protein Mlh3 isoform X3 [Gopherus evgoodei]